MAGLAFGRRMTQWMAGGQRLSRDVVTSKQSEILANGRSENFATKPPLLRSLDVA
jgi:hypothetical protein